ncbi:MAG TPA: efflux RND transporter periplasmic adaptor subunit [Gammaproteobacteria bacterium]|jgi:HlyD family secretion protein|nr:efflux RND transporter periplasmic adaptor subunit [Gammaproteobacteria bacterium]
MKALNWRRPWPLAGLALLIALAVAGWRQWQGPLLPAYRLEPRPLVQTVVATGRVVAPIRVQVSSEITAAVSERRVQEGDVVAPGDVLAVLRADDLAARVREAEASLEQLRRGTRPLAEAALREAEAGLVQTTRESQRRRELFERQLIARESLEQAEQAEVVARAAADTARVRLARLALGDADEAVLRERLAAAQAALAKTQIRASVAGTVLTRNAEPGDVAQPGKVLFEIARSGVTELLVPLDEKNLGAIALDQTARCVADAYPNDVFAARVSLITPKIDPLRGTVDIRLTVDPVPDYLRQDMTVSVNIETARRASALAIPNDAVLVGNDGRASVLAVRNGRAERVPVQLGLRGLTHAEVVGGLSAGDTVLADPTLPAGRRVRTEIQTQPLASARAIDRELPMPPN